MAARMAVATSLEVLIPRPTCPSESPMTTMALNRVRWPARVCFWTGLIYFPNHISILPSNPPSHAHRILELAYLHNLILQLWQEEVHDLVLLDRQRVQVYFLHGLDLSFLHKTTKLGNWLPFLLLVLVGAATRSTSSSSAASVTTVSSSIATGSESTSTSRSSASWCVSHFCSN